MSTFAIKNNRFLNFKEEQIGLIRKSSLLVFFGKTGKVLLFILASPISLLTRILVPFVIVRCKVLPSDRIGHFSANPELYLCEQEVGMHNPRNFDIFYYNASISNYQLKKMWDRTLRVHWFGKWIDRANCIIPGGREHKISLPPDTDIHNLLNRTKAHLSFTDEEERLGKERLLNLGISGNSPFICFHARDTAYLERLRSDVNCDYHNYRDSNIYDYIPAVEKLTQRGYFAVRMGKIVKERLNISNPKIIDYAVNSRSDFMDIYLAAKCRFFISSGTGIDSVSVIFRTPVVYVNYIPLKVIPTATTQDLFIVKKLWLKRERRFLRFREILDSELGSAIRNDQYEKLGIEIIDNTPEEIAALAIEMDERLKGIWQISREDQELQQHFWSLFKSSGVNQTFFIRIGAEFLRQNQELLE